jgi:serine protease AprX
MIRILSIIFLIISLQLSAQNMSHRYIIKFQDKNVLAKSLSNPEIFLSIKAIERREKHGIAIDSYDFPISSDYLAKVRAIGAKVIYQSKWLNTIIVETSNPDCIFQINKMPFVAHIQEFIDNARISASYTEKPFFSNETIVPSNQYLSSKAGQSAASANYGSAFNQIDMISGIPLHDRGYRGQGMTIAVLDAGFNSVDILHAFDSLWANNQILGTHDFVEPNNNVFNTGIASHGMMVLSTMGGNIPGQIIGTAPKASYWLLRSEDTRNNVESLMEEYNWVNAAEFADSVGADVINSSLGYTEFDNPDENHTYADMDGNTTPITIGADRAAQKGILVVNSAGNDGAKPWHFIGAPADGDSVFTIGAVDPQGNYAFFSSTGPTFDGRIKPNIVSQGAPAAVADLNNGVSFGNGTSFSSPIIAGMSACLWQAHQNNSNMDIINALQQSGSQASNPDSLIGYGIPDFVAADTFLSQNNIVKTSREDIRISPNPFRSSLTVLFESNIAGMNTHIILESINGKKVIEMTDTGGNKKITINNLAHLTRGVYLLFVHSGNQQWVKKVVKY